MKKNMNKVLVIVLAVALLAMSIVAGTLAYLMHETDPVVNTFAVGYDISITLTEKESADAQTTVTAREIDYIPALQDVYKDPTITVTGNDCYVFVGVEVSANFDTYVTYALDDDVWDLTPVGTLTSATGTINVYKTKNSAPSATDAVLNVLDGKQVDFNADVDEMPAQPLKMTFTAYAIQSVGLADADDAWDELYGALTAQP